MSSVVSTRQSKRDDHPVEVTKTSNRPFILQNDIKISPKNENTFPWRLQLVLDAAETEGFTDIISWTDNTSFRVHDQDAFVNKIMPRFFQQSKYKSFQRQCNLYSFDRISHGPQKGGYTRNEYFVRGQPELVAKIQRQRIKGPLSKRRSRKATMNIQPVIASDGMSIVSSASTNKSSKLDERIVSPELESNQSVFDCSKTIPDGTSSDLCTMIVDDDENENSLNQMAYGDTLPSLLPTDDNMIVGNDELLAVDEPDNFADLDVLGLDLLDDDGYTGGVLLASDLTDLDTPLDSSSVTGHIPTAECDDAFYTGGCHAENEEEPRPIVYLDSVDCGVKSNIIDFLVSEKRSRQSCQVSTSSSTEVSSCTSSVSTSSANDLSTIVHDSQSHTSPICDMLRNPSHHACI